MSRLTDEYMEDFLRLTPEEQEERFLFALRWVSRMLACRLMRRIRFDPQTLADRTIIELKAKRLD
jgi:hypothetical protein